MCLFYDTQISKTRWRGSVPLFVLYSADSSRFGLLARLFVLDSIGHDTTRREVRMSYRLDVQTATRNEMDLDWMGGWIRLDELCEYRHNAAMYFCIYHTSFLYL